MRNPDSTKNRSTPHQPARVTTQNSFSTKTLGCMPPKIVKWHRRTSKIKGPRIPSSAGMCGLLCGLLNERGMHTCSSSSQIGTDSVSYGLRLKPKAATKSLKQASRGLRKKERYELLGSTFFWHSSQHSSLVSSLLRTYSLTVSIPDCPQRERNSSLWPVGSTSGK
jgi:hypothetical protein